MTTIAFDGKTLASDSRVTSGDHIHQGAYQKIWRIDDDTLYTFCGSYEAGLKLLAYLKQETSDQPTWKRACQAVLVYRSKGKPKIRTYEGGGLWIDHLGKYAAFGSGGAYALGALAAGASAREAVKIAMKFDCGSGGTIKTMEIE